MGLTIHYTIKAPTDWTPEILRAKLEQVRQFAKALPVKEVSDMAEFTGLDCDFQHVRDSGKEEQDEFFWAKIQGQRHLMNPWQPGTHASQSPGRMLVFSVLPADGCEQMNVGICSFPQHVWKASEESSLAWSLVFDKFNHYPESRKVMRTFMRRWKLRRLPKSKATIRQRFGWSDKMLCHHQTGYAQAAIHKGRYLSHRRGYSGPVGLVILRDQTDYELAFRFMGSAEEAETVLSSPAFKADLGRMVGGEDYVTPAATGWGSFCKTQYANDPRCGGWQNFVRAHLSVLAILEKLQGLGFKVHVRDESDFWTHRDMSKLAKTIGQWDAFVAGMAGTLKDVAGAQGQVVETAMDGRPDFERLEMKGQGKMAEWLRKAG